MGHEREKAGRNNMPLRGWPEEALNLTRDVRLKIRNHVNEGEQ
jgi:hypothetical protein